MIRFNRTLSLATCLVLLGAVAGTAQRNAGMGEHRGDGPPPMLVLMPPPGVDKPAGMEMSDDPYHIVEPLFKGFFQMMDQNGNGELSADELSGWVHPPPHMNGMDDGMGRPDGMNRPPMDGTMDGAAGEQVRRLQEELHRVHQEQRMRRMEEMNHRRDRIREQLAQMRQEQQRMAEHMREMEAEAQRVNEELEKANSEPPMEQNR
ncbi:MAG: hypothetical protein O2782_14520 [bacterium]|nr:hypothetical protein [bacterium]